MVGLGGVGADAGLAGASDAAGFTVGKGDLVAAALDDACECARVV